MVHLQRFSTAEISGTLVSWLVMFNGIMKHRWLTFDLCRSHYLITLATSGEIGVLRQEYRSLVPNVRHPAVLWSIT